MSKPRLPRRIPAIIAVLALTCAAPAHAYLYWASHQRSIGRTANNGSKRKLYFIKIRGGVAGGIAVNASYIYWENPGEIGRADLDGSGIRRTFIHDGGSALAIDGAHLYWDSGQGIGRANLDGTDVEPGFINFHSAHHPHGLRITPHGLIFGLAVDSTHIYWSQWADNVIGRANIDGSGVDRAFLRTKCPGPLAVDADHLYWAFFGGNPRYNRACLVGGIGRANIDGGGVRTFAKGTGVTTDGIAVDRRYIYVTDPPALGIGRMTLNG